METSDSLLQGIGSSPKPFAPPPAQTVELRQPDPAARYEVPEEFARESKGKEADAASGKGREPDSDIKGLAEEVQAINKIAEKSNHRFRYDLYETTEELFVQVIDRKSNEVVRQIPPEELLELHARIHEQVGFLLDEQA